MRNIGKKGGIIKKIPVPELCGFEHSLKSLKITSNSTFA